MLIYLTDDEPLSLETLRRTVSDAAPLAELRCFSSAADVLMMIDKLHDQPDICFLDIEMPGMTGLELAVRIKERVPECGIIFVTGYTEYALDAYQIHANGYVVKPVTTRRIREELDHLRLAPNLAREPQPGKLEVRCFGPFDVYMNGEPVFFARAKTRELLAYLVDRQGTSVSRRAIASILWEDDKYDRTRQKYLDVLIRCMRDSLSEFGAEDIIEMKKGMLRVLPEKMDCDMYRFFEGDVDTINAYRGEYMTGYSWANNKKYHFIRT